MGCCRGLIYHALVGGNMIHRQEAVIGGRVMSIETGRVAEQASGAVLVRYGETVILATVVGSDEPREGIDFFPLTVDVEERMYAAGKIPGGFIKREGRASEHAILACRLADRPLRPLFPKGFRNDVQIVITVLSVDQENDSDILGIVGASAALSLVQQELVESLGTEYPDRLKEIIAFYEKELKAYVRSNILDKGIRPDGRDLKTIRPITCEVGLLPRTHGSALFTRGQTQVLSVITLGSPGDEQVLDGLGASESKRFMHHYNFPPFSTGESKPLRGPGGREIGHGALAERAVAAVIPPSEDFHYTIRAVSDVLSSNGSTSMGSVCGTTLALMDAGVPISAPVAGVAMGLITGEGERNGKWAVLSDIQGIEDALGDMDFKVAGTADGVTALQMDIKGKAITHEIMAKALEQAREGRTHIREKTLATH